MKHATHVSLQRRRPARGFSLVEVIFALLLVGLVYVAAINTLGAARISQVRTHHHTLGYTIAQIEMSATLALPYADVASKTRQELPSHAGWHREILVDPVDPDQPGTVVASDTGARRIRVIVYRGSSPIAQLVTVRTSPMPAADIRVEAAAP